MSTRTPRAGLVALAALAGCATRADLVQRDREVWTQLKEQKKQLQAVQREVQRLRADVEEGGHGRRSAGGDDRLVALEQRLDQLERQAGGTPPPPPEEVTTETPPSVAATPPTTLAPPKPPEEDGWTREVTREQAAAAGGNAPERTEYAALMDGLARKDCSRTVPQLNTFASKYRESPLADNALYWAARCYQTMGRREDAISKFYEVGTRYPKSDRAAAALWEQANLFLAMGNSPDARIVFSKLIKDYGSSEEAARARQKLSEIEN